MKMPLSHSPVRLFFFFLSFQKTGVIIFMAICVLLGVIPSIDSILLQKITDALEALTDNQAADILSVMFFWAVTYGLWWEGLNILWRVYDYIYLKTIPIIKGKIIDEVYNYTQYNEYKFFQENLAGHITNRITEAARAFELVFSILTEKIMRKIAVIVFALITMRSVHPTLALLFFVWLSVFIILSSFFSGRINQYASNFARNRSLVAGRIVDSIANISAVRMFSSQRFERKYLNGYIDNTVKSEQDMQWFMFKLRYVLGTFSSIMIFLIIYYLSVFRSQLLISVGDCVLILTLCLAVIDDVWDLTQEIGDIFEEIGTFSQSMSLIKPYIIVDAKDAVKLEVSTGKLEFKNVTFYYQDNKNLFKNKSVMIKGEQKVGLVGFSGSGKSTFVNLIARFHDIEKGEILIDGQNIKNVTQKSLRENISIIPQEPILFHRTIMENIRYGRKEATDEEVIEAAKLAHIHEFIITLPEGYNTQCGERGNNLSGGQRQRVAIARAILKNAPILILDEATSALDSTTENLIQESLKYLMQNKTVLVIAHRLSTLLNMDRILVFDKGQIVEDGKHEELLKQGKVYKKLWKSQVKGLIAENP